MFERVTKLNKLTKAVNNHAGFATNPIEKGEMQSIYSILSEKANLVSGLSKSEEKYKEISEIADIINSLSENEIKLLVSHENEMIRSMASKAFVDKSDKDEAIESLKKMLIDNNEFVRESAVIALAYINSMDILPVLERATLDNCARIRLRALTGIADLASEYSSFEAKTILKRFINDEDQGIREFISDELSILE